MRAACWPAEQEPLASRGQSHLESVSSSHCPCGQCVTEYHSCPHDSFSYLKTQTIAGCVPAAFQAISQFTWPMLWSFTTVSLQMQTLQWNSLSRCGLTHPSPLTLQGCDSFSSRCHLSLEITYVCCHTLNVLTASCHVTFAPSHSTWFWQ